MPVLLLCAGLLCYLWWLRTPPVAQVFRSAAEEIEDAAFLLLTEDTPPGNLPWIKLTPQERTEFTALLPSISVGRYGFWQESRPSPGPDLVRFRLSLEGGEVLSFDFYPGGRYIVLSETQERFHVPDADRLYEAVQNIYASHT